MYFKVCGSYSFLKFSYAKYYAYTSEEFYQSQMNNPLQFRLAGNDVPILNFQNKYYNNNYIKI